MTRFFRQLRAFRAAAAKSRQPWLSNLRWLRPWSRSLRKGANSVRDESPWMTFRAIAQLERHLKTLGGKARVFEWGSGGSTLFFARRAAEVIAVENDGDWAEKVRAACQERGLSHATIAFHAADNTEPPPGFDPADPEKFFSGSAIHNGHLFRSYAEHINQFPSESFDVIVVDGRVRPACLRFAMPKLKPGGLLVLDNAERPWYARARALVDAEQWPRTDHNGPGPYNQYFWQTAIWRRPTA
jgi:predicted O-methyltransferase YrrM